MQGTLSVDGVLTTLELSGAWKRLAWTQNETCIRKLGFRRDAKLLR